MNKEFTDQFGVTRKRAMLCNKATKKCIDGSWKPLISDEEMENANFLLEEDYSIWEWRWVENIVNLAGAVTLAEKSDNAKLQFLSHSYSS